MSFYFLVLGLNISAIIYPKKIAAVIPPAAPVIPPVNAPNNPDSSTAFIADFAKVFPKPGNGIVAPAPPKSTILSYIPKAPSIVPKVTNITQILAGVSFVVSINI